MRRAIIRGDDVNSYPNISDHGLIGDLQTAALVTTDGTIDFFCCPRFDSPSVFASLLDAEHGGHFKIAPATDDYVTRQLYFPDTAMLMTRFMTADGVGEVLDFMPVIEGPPTDRHRIVRKLRVSRGTMKFVMDLQPRFDYGRAEHTIEPANDGAVFRAGDFHLTVHTSGRRPAAAGRGHRRAGGQRHPRDVLPARRRARRRASCWSRWAATPQQLPPEELDRLANDTGAFWRSWLSRSTYTGRWREIVTRSAMTLKLLTYNPTGAPVAAATFGLPEQAGGERNWDYRYTWIRDASLSIHALAGLGYMEEVAKFGMWLRDRAAEQAGDGIRAAEDHVPGGRVLGPRPRRPSTTSRAGASRARSGSATAPSDQLQLDIYGEAMDAMFAADDHGLPMAHQGWQAMAKISDWLCDNWDQPDEGVWETRGGRKDFTYGRFQSWVALDRAIKLADRHGRPANRAKWIEQRDAIYNQIMQRGWNPGAEGVHPALRHRRARLIAAVHAAEGLHLAAGPDVDWRRSRRWTPSWCPTAWYTATTRRPLRTGSAATRARSRCARSCTSNALAQAGRLDDAALTFNKMQTYANHLGLYSEEIGQTGEQLGNFPQAFTHLALINSALSLNTMLDERLKHVPSSGGMVG